MSATTTTIAPTGATREQISLRDTVTDSLVITRRNLVRVIRLPQLLLFATIQPVMFLVLFNYVFGGAIGQTLPPVVEGKYIIFLLPGLMVQISAFGAGQTAMGLTEDLANGVVDRFRSLPMARSAVLAGRTLADLARNAFVMGLMLGIAFLMGFRWKTSLLGFLAAFVLVLLFAYALSWVMATLGLLIRNPEAVQTAVFLPIFPFVFASAVFIPTQTMPGWLQAFANNQPVTVVANAMRGLMIGPEMLLPGQTVAGQVGLALVWIGLITAVFSVIAVRLYRRAVL